MSKTVIMRACGAFCGIRWKVPRGLGGGLDNLRKIAPQGRAVSGVTASQLAPTPPLALQKEGTWYTYNHDLTKNVTEV